MSVFDKKDEFGDIAEKVSSPAPNVTTEQLLKMFMDQAKETAASNKALADALLQSRVPYIDPEVVAARQQRAKDRKMLVENEMNLRANAKKYCSHKHESGMSNIKWQQHSNSIIMGVCGTCRSEFDCRKPEERALLLADQNGLRKMGRAGDHSNTRFKQST